VTRISSAVGDIVLAPTPSVFTVRLPTLGGTISTGHDIIDSESSTNTRITIGRVWADFNFIAETSGSIHVIGLIDTTCCLLNLEI
jgi:hypothetical protein